MLASFPEPHGTSAGLDPLPDSSPAKTAYGRGLARRGRDFWGELGARIAVAGGLYPLVVVGGWTAATFAFELVASATLYRGDFGRLGYAFVPVVAAPFIFGIGILWTGFITMVVTPVVAAMTKLVGWPTERDIAGVLTGSFVAYLATLPLALPAAQRVTADSFGVFAIVLAHIALAIAMGQAAGCYAAFPELRRRRRGLLPPKAFRFGLWQLLAMTVPVSLLLAVLSLANLMTPPMALASIAAAFCAAASWKPIPWLVNQRLDRRIAKRQRERLARRSTWNNPPA